MTWIQTVAYEDANGRLKMLYDRVKGRDDNVDNIMMAHSLRPHSMDGHMALYKYVLHHSGNQTPKWFLEAIGVLVSHLNRCHYCFDHHFTGMARLLEDADRAAAIGDAISAGSLRDAFSDREVAALDYAQKLTLTPADMTENDLAPLRAAGKSPSGARVWGVGCWRRSGTWSRISLTDRHGSPVVTAILQSLYILRIGPTSVPETPIRNLGVSYHCPSFRDWRPSVYLGAFFLARFVLEWSP